MEHARGEYNFKKDILKGENGENEIKEILESFGFKYIGNCKNNQFDLIMEYNRVPYTYEIKTDTYLDTGNLVVEIESRGKLSGISVTNADYFLTYFRNKKEIWTIKTDSLKELIKENNFFLKNGGDKGSNTKFYIIKKEKFKSHFQVYKID